MSQLQKNRWCGRISKIFEQLYTREFKKLADVAENEAFEVPQRVSGIRRGLYNLTMSEESSRYVRSRKGLRISTVMVAPEYSETGCTTTVPSRASSACLKG